MDPREKKSDPQSDRNLEQDLELLRAAWPEPDASEPPGLVDQGIMNMARRELASQGSGRRPVRWLSAFATAAIVVLALTVVIQQDQQPVPLAPAEQDGFMIDTLKKQEAKRDAGSRADAEPVKKTRGWPRNTGSCLPDPNRRQPMTHPLTPPGGSLLRRRWRRLSPKNQPPPPLYWKTKQKAPQ